jgi:hypothetical protein
LVVLPKLSSQLYKTFGRESTARLVGRMVAPDPQFHAIARVCQNEFAIRFSFSLRLRSGRFHLHVHARRRRAILGRPANFGKGQ